MTAREEHVGKRAKCPHCGAVITIEEEVVLEESPPRKAGFEAITLDIGRLHSQNGVISLSIRVTDQGQGFVWLYVCEKDTRRKGEVISLNLQEFQSLTELLNKVSQAIAQLQASKQMRKLES
jgi:hypothetical protein